MNALFVFLLLALPIAAEAVESLVVGSGGRSFEQVRESSHRISVSADSLWIWEAERGENIAPRVLERGGRIFAVAEKVDAQGFAYPTLLSRPSLARMLDGDAGTAFDPAADGIPRQIDVYIDLGAHYGVEQIRFFPRLDAGHRDRYLQAFQLGSDGLDPSEIETDIFDVCCGSPTLINAHINAPNNQSIVLWPHPNQPHDPRPMRHVRLRTLSERDWEIAEFEVIADGSAPPGAYLSVPLEVRNARPVWGRLLINGQPPETLPVIVQTRSGPDLAPVQYFLERGADLVLVSKNDWATAIPGIQAPPRDNPLWSRWESLNDGQVSSPPQPVIQFRIQLLQPGTRIDQVAIEYTSRPLAQELAAEINPRSVAPGRETPFAIDLRARRLVDSGGVDSGFRYVEIQTQAEIVAIDSVFVQDRPAFYSTEPLPSGGVSLRFAERIDPQGSFIQVFFRARVFVDGTDFRVRARDRRPTGAGDEDAYQTAVAADVDPRTPGGTLRVRLATERVELLDDVRLRSAVFTPNGDGRGEYFVLTYSVLRLTQSASVSFGIYDLAGRLVRRGYASDDPSGSYLRVWDGLDFSGRLVPPGTYLYGLEVDADAKKTTLHGVVNVVY